MQGLLIASIKHFAAGVALRAVAQKSRRFEILRRKSSIFTLPSRFTHLPASHKRKISFDV